MPTKKTTTKPVFSLGKEMKENYVINKDGKPTKYSTIDKTPEAKKVIKTLNKNK